MRKKTLDVVVIPTYYVDATGGKDTNDGLSPATAWQTLTKVNGAALNPGDHVKFKRGQTWTGALVPVRSGTESAYIVYEDYGEGALPVINGSGAYALWVTNAYHYLRFNNIDFAGSTGASVPTARFTSSYGYFYNCIFRDSAAYIGFVAFGATTGADVHHVTLENCEAKGNSKSGYYISSATGAGGPHDILVVGCSAHNNGTSATADHGFYVAFGIIMDNCVAYSNASAGIKVNCNLHPGSPYKPLVKNCTMYSNVDGLYVGHDYGVFVNNLVYGNTKLNLHFDADGDNCLIIFNTFVNSTSATDRTISLVPLSSPGNVIKNNLFIQDSAVVSYPIMYLPTTLADAVNNETWDYNTYYWNGVATAHIIYANGETDKNKDWNEWKTAGAEPHGTLLTALPGFVTRYTNLHPATGGNIKGLGVAIEGYTVDKDGQARANPPTPGCYE